MKVTTANGRVARGRATPARCVQRAWCVWLAWIALLLPLCGPARAYDIFSEPPAGRFAMNLDLGTAPFATSGYGVTTWNALAQNALDAWNQTGIGPQLDHNFFSVRNPAVAGDACGQDGVNEVRFAPTLCGLAFGNALAVTYKRTTNGTRVESDVVFDSGRTWNAYPGPLQPGITDFYRVAIHEFGHVAGLDHPDEDGQIKTALMNSQISNIDSLQADDIDGAHRVNWIWFAFTAQSGAAINAAVTSNAITVTGLSAPAAIAIAGGEYSIAGGPYTSAPGTVSGGQAVTLRVTASRVPMTAVTATLGIGAAAGEFTAITTAGGTPITVSTSGYSPLVDNSSKTYLKNDTEVIVSTVLPGTTLINGIATKAVQSSDGETSYDTNDGNGIREHRQFKSNAYLQGLGFTAITVTFIPPILEAPAIVTMGQAATSSGTANYVISAAGINANLSYVATFTMEGFETITVPAGTFNTVRVNQSVNLSGSVAGNPVNQSSTGIVWVASGIGTVKDVTLSGDVTTRVLTSTSLATDATPDAFSLAPQSGIPINTLVASNTVTVSSINAPASIAISAGEYSINGGSYTSAPGTVNDRDTVTVRLASAGTYSSARSATLTIGGTSSTFTVVTVPDTSAPSVPAGLGADPVSTAQINLTWSASTDDAGVTAYKVYRGGSLIATLGNVTSYSNTGLAASTSYSYTVAACDAAGNCSAQSASAAASTLADTTAPSAPAALTATAVSSVQINLAWSAATDNVGVTQYQVYRGGTLIATLNAPVTGYGDGVLAAATPYSYAVAACDAAGNCSVQSTPSAATTLAAGSTNFTPSLAPSWNLLGNSLNITLDVAALFGSATAPVGGVSSNIVSIWKWDAANSVWAYYAPQLTTAQIAAFTTSKGYLVLSAIGPGEGYWVNAGTAFTMAVQSGAAFNYGSVNYSVLPPSWNLIATAQNVYPTAFANAVSQLPPPAGGQVNAADTFVSLWAWDAAQAAWYYYSPVLENTTGTQGGLTAVKNFATSKGYLHFQDSIKKLDVGTGFWVNKP